MSDFENVRTKPEPGSLVAELNVSSYRLREQLSIEVRDSSLALVGELHSGRPLLDLAPGYYEVKTIMDDGRAHTKVVRVNSGERARVEFEVEPTSLMERSGTTQYKRGYDPTAYAFLRAETVQWTPSEYPLSAEVGSFGPQDGDWLLVPIGHLSAVPWVSFAAEFISLPVNPRGRNLTESAAVVRVVEFEMSTSARAWVHPDRKLTSAMQHMLSESRVFQAHTLAEAAAEDLLQAKYSDPVGATLGAIVMHRAGTLDKRIAWLENLQRDFDWLPDGKILLAAELLAVQPVASRAFELLTKAAKQRPMFTASFAILLETLRRWPSHDAFSAEASQLAEILGKIAVDVDWTAFTLTTINGPKWP